MSSSKDSELKKDQLWFLMTCIMSSETGKLEKVNWDMVTEKMKMKTKSAARMRYYRLLASYGLTMSYTTKNSKAASPSLAEDLATAEPSTRTPKQKFANRPHPDPEQQDRSGDTEE